MFSGSINAICNGDCLVKTIVVNANTAVYGRFTCQKGDKLMERLFYVTKGVFHIKEKGGEEINASAGTLLYLPSDVEYDSRWDNNSEGAYIAFNYLLYDLSGNALHLSDRIMVAAVDKNGEFHRLLSDSADTYVRHEKYADLALQSQFYKLLYNMFRQQERKSIRADKNLAEIYKAIIYLNDNYMSDVTTEQLAKMCNISDTTFRRIFKKHMSVSPMKYKQTLRMNRAKDMLESGVYTVSEVSELMKCTDPSHFNRLYYSAFGINPSVSKKMPD